VKGYGFTCLLTSKWGCILSKQNNCKFCITRFENITYPRGVEVTCIGCGKQLNNISSDGTSERENKNQKRI
jgi:hypothetical protein